MIGWQNKKTDHLRVTHLIMNCFYLGPTKIFIIFDFFQKILGIATIVESLLAVNWPPSSNMFNTN